MPREERATMAPLVAVSLGGGERGREGCVGEVAAGRRKATMQALRRVYIVYWNCLQCIFILIIGIHTLYLRVTVV